MSSCIGSKTKKGAGQSRLASPRSHLVAVGLRLEVDGVDAVALFADDVVVCRCVWQRRVGRQILVHLRQRPVRPKRKQKKDNRVV